MEAQKKPIILIGSSQNDSYLKPQIDKPDLTMNEFRKIMLEEKEKDDLELFEKIKDNSKPDILDLWALSEERFIEWRKLHDFPVLLNHFDNTLSLFKEWKTEFNLTNQVIIDTGYITPFLEAKKLAKADKLLHLTKQSYDGKEGTFVSHEKIEGERVYLGTKYNLQFIQSFVSYTDWLKSKGKSQQILHINSRHAPNSDNERVFIHTDVYKPKSDFELLKMGGIVAPTNAFGALSRGKRMEFVNLCGLKFTGEIHFGEEGNLSCSYSACDNWVGIDFNMPLLYFEHCSITNFKLYNSQINSWSFYDCAVFGDFENSKLYNVRICGGNFNPILQDCTLSNAHFQDDPNVPDHNLEGYKKFKKIYQAQGDDDIAKAYFIKENEMVRKQLKGLKFIGKSISHFYWEYGSKPHRIIYISLAIILLSAFIFWWNADLISWNLKGDETFDFLDSIYFSTITFTTLGYGDFSPTGWLRIITSIEAFSGVINMGFIIAGYSNNKY